jgi:hypothetical protein
MVPRYASAPSRQSSCRLRPYCAVYLETGQVVGGFETGSVDHGVDRVLDTVGGAHTRCVNSVIGEVSRLTFRIAKVGNHSRDINGRVHPTG